MAGWGVVPLGITLRFAKHAAIGRLDAGIQDRSDGQIDELQHHSAWEETDAQWQLA